MPIVDGKYVAQILTYYKTVEEAKDKIKKKLKRVRKVRISNVPTYFLRELMPLLKEKDLAVILAEGQKPWPELTELCDVARSKGLIYVDYKGIEAKAGNVSFADISFNVLWKDEEIIDITAMNYSACVKCQRGNFETGWRYSEKLTTGSKKKGKKRSSKKKKKK